MKQHFLILLILLLCNSCMVSTKRFTEVETRNKEYSDLIKNQEKEIATLKSEKGELSKERMSLEGDTLRLYRQIKLMNDRYQNLEERGSISAIVAKRKAEEFQQTLRRKDSELVKLNQKIEKRRDIINNLEIFLIKEINSLFLNNDAVLYQTKGGLNLEFSDCKVLRNDSMISYVDSLADRVVPYLQVNSEISVLVDSYAAKNDTLTTTTEVWEYSLKKGALFANMLIDRGVDAKRVEVVSHGISYPYKSGVDDQCPLRTIVKFNVDASEIIELFDNLLKSQF